MRPTFFADITDLSLREEDQSFLLGKDLLVIPRWAEGLEEPKGDWKQVWFEAEDDGYQPLVKLRPGAIVPMESVVQSTADYNTDSVTLLVNPNSEDLAHGQLYHDQGDGFDFRDGAYAIHSFSCEPHAEDSIVVTISQVEGNMTVDRKYRIGYVTNSKIYYSDWSSESIVYARKAPEVETNLVADLYQIEQGGTVVLTAEVNTEGDVDHVDFFQGDDLLGTKSEAPYDWSWTGDQLGMHSFKAVAHVNTDFSATSSELTVLVGSFGSGQLRQEIWHNLAGQNIVDLTSFSGFPAEPDEINFLSEFQSSTDIGDEYGQKIYGYVHPPATGSYTFYISGDDYCDLYMSSDSLHEHKAFMARVPGWTNQGEWNKYSAQTSQQIELVAGEKYYIEALHKEGQFGDFVAVAWTGPGIEQEIIPGAFLSPGVPSAPLSYPVRQYRNITLFPNPSNQSHFEVRINGWNGEELHATIYDSVGRLIQSSSHNSDHFELEIPGGRQGVYVVSIQFDDQVIKQRMVIR